MENGFIKLYRQIQNWEWYTDSATVHFFIHCILSANWKDKRWQGKEVKRGQFITSYAHLSMQTGLSVKQIRIRIDRLVDSGEIEYKGASNHSVITVCNYNTYQPKHVEEGKQKTHKGQSKGNQRATTKEGKEYKEGKNNTTVTALADDIPNASDSESWHASIRVANRLLESICDTDPTHKYNRNEPSIHTWVKDIDLALRRDGRTEEQFNFIIDAIFYDSHKYPNLWDQWSTNIESGKKLRDKFDKIKNQIKPQKNEQTIRRKISETEKFLSSI